MVKEEKKIKVKEAPPKSDIFYVISLFSPSPSLRSSQNGQRPPSPLATNTMSSPSHTWMPISVKLNFFPEAFPVYSVRTTCFSKLLISNMYFSAPRFMLSLPLVNSGFLPWGTLIHYKLSMNWIYVHFFSGSFQVLGRYLLLSEIPGKHMVNKNVYFHQSANSTPLPRLHVPTVLDLLTHEFPDRSESWQLNHRQ